MYPSSQQEQRNNRAKVDSELASFYSGTQFRTFKEITLAPGAVYVMKMSRAVDLVIRGFQMQVNSGEMRCDIYRGATFSGTFADSLLIIPKCEFANLPIPIYATKCAIVGGGDISGGTLYDLMHVKTAGATGQAATVGRENQNSLGAPAGSIGGYRFSNPGNASATAIFSMWWEELPAP